jgi:hypothetical protein
MKTNTIEKIPFDKKHPKTWGILTTIGVILLFLLLILYFIAEMQPRFS